MNNYDTLDEFNGELAAKLIAGANDTTANQDAYQVVLKKLHAAYQAALDYYNLVRDIGWSPRPPLLRGPAMSLQPSLSSGAIRSKMMLACERNLEHEGRGGSFAGWLTVGKTDFASQEFTRSEVIRWLTAKGLTSVYAFALDTIAQANNPTPAQTAMPAPVVADGPAKPPSSKSKKTLIFEATVLDLLNKFWNDRTPGTKPTKSDLCKLVFAEILRTTVRGERKTTQSMVNDVAKKWPMPIVLPAFVPDSKFNGNRHPFKGER